MYMMVIARLFSVAKNIQNHSFHQQMNGTSKIGHIHTIEFY